MATLAAQKRCFHVVGVPSQRVSRPQSQERCSCLFTCFVPALVFYAPALPVLPALILSRSARSRSSRSAMRGNRERFWKTLDFRSWTTGVQDPKEPLPKGSRCPEIHESQVSFKIVKPVETLYIYIYICVLYYF